MINSKTIEIQPMSVGAEVFGLDCSQEIPSEIQQKLYSAWLEYGFLIIRDPVKEVADQMRLSRCFGELEKHPVPEIWVPGEPYLIQLGGNLRGQPYVYDGELRINCLAWHRDTAYTLDICKGAALRIIEMPPEGGETYIGDTAAAYDDLPDATKLRIEDLECKVRLVTDPMKVDRGAVWNHVRPATVEEWPAAADMKPNLSAKGVNRYPPVIQPLVITHPESGRKCLFLSPSYPEFIIGLPRSESDELLAELTEHMTRDKYVMKQAWAPGQVVVWDNRRCIHAAPGYHPKYRRLGHRTTLAGSLKTGRFFDEADNHKVHEHVFSADRD